MNHELLLANVQDYIEHEDYMKAVPEGARIVCPNPNCQAPIFEVVKQIELGESPSLDHLHPLRPDAIKSSESCTCPACGKAYYVNGAVHTHFGWYPYNP